MNTPTIIAPAAVIRSTPDSRLEALAAEYANLKPQADAAAARLKEITDAIKTELATAAPGKQKIDLISPMLAAPLRMQARTSWRLNTNRLKAEDPVTYVRYAEQRTTWELRVVAS